MKRVDGLCIHYDDHTIKCDPSLVEDDPHINEYVQMFAEDMADVQTIEQSRRYLSRHNNDGTWTIISKS